MLYLLLVIGASAGFIILAFALFVVLDSFRHWLVALGFRLSGNFYRLSKRINLWKSRRRVTSIPASKIMEGTIDARNISSVSVIGGQIMVSPLSIEITPSSTKSPIRRSLLGVDDDIREALRQGSIRRQKAQEDKDKGGSAA